MTAPTPTRTDLAAMDRYITQALASLRTARDACTRSPNGDSIRQEEDAEARLNALLERRFAALTRQ